MHFLFILTSFEIYSLSCKKKTDLIELNQVSKNMLSKNIFTAYKDIRRSIIECNLKIFNVYSKNYKGNNIGINVPKNGTKKTCVVFTFARYNFFIAIHFSHEP